MYQKVYVSKNRIEGVFEIIQRLQEACPLKSVSKKDVKSRLRNHLSARKNWKEKNRFLGRAFKKLTDEGRIKRHGRGQYWLPSYLDRNIEYLRKKSQFDEKVGAWYMEQIRRLKEELFTVKDHAAMDAEEVMHKEILEEERTELDQWRWSWKTEPALQEKTRKRKKSRVDEFLEGLFASTE